MINFCGIFSNVIRHRILEMSPRTGGVVYACTLLQQWLQFMLLLIFGWSHFVVKKTGRWLKTWRVASCNFWQRKGWRDVNERQRLSTMRRLYHTMTPRCNCVLRSITTRIYLTHIFIEFTLLHQHIYLYFLIIIF